MPARPRAAPRRACVGDVSRPPPLTRRCRWPLPARSSLSTSPTAATTRPHPARPSRTQWRSGGQGRGGPLRWSRWAGPCSSATHPLHPSHTRPPRLEQTTGACGRTRWQAWGRTWGPERLGRALRQGPASRGPRTLGAMAVARPVAPPTPAAAFAWCTRGRPAPSGGLTPAPRTASCSKRTPRCWTCVCTAATPPRAA